MRKDPRRRTRGRPKRRSTRVRLQGPVEGKMARAGPVMLIGRRSLIREGLTHVLRRSAGVRKITIVEDVAEAPARFRSSPPKLIVIDRDSLGPFWITALRKVREFAGDVPILLLGERRCNPGAGWTCAPECTAWLPTSVDGDTLARLINDMIHGGVSVCPARQECCKNLATPDTGRHGATKPPAELTPTELRVLKHLALGHTVRQAATSLRVSPKTVDNHKTQIMHKLELHDRASLVHYAISEGLVALRAGMELKLARRGRK